MTVKRITLSYGGTVYSLADADIEDLKRQLLEVHTGGAPFWLQVNHGEGSYRETELLIAPGVSVAITGIDPE